MILVNIVVLLALLWCGYYVSDELGCLWLFVYVVSACYLILSQMV